MSTRKYQPEYEKPKKKEEKSKNIDRISNRIS